MRAMSPVNQYFMSPVVSKLSRTLHWTSSALSLALLLFFSVTGITLNHPDWFEADRSSEEQRISLPADWLQQFGQTDALGQLNLVAQLVSDHWQLSIPRNIERDDVEWVLDYQRPGGLTTVVVDLDLGEVTMERVDDGLVALINDLHKGRHSGKAWRVLIDVTALVCIFFSVTGVLLLIVHARKRPSTWPLVLAGTVLPFLIYWSFVP